MQRFSAHLYTSEADYGMQWAVRERDAEAAIAKARKQATMEERSRGDARCAESYRNGRQLGAADEREAMWKWLCDEASRPDSKDQTVAYNQGARDALNYVKNRFKSRGALELRCEVCETILTERNPPWNRICPTCGNGFAVQEPRCTCDYGRNEKMACHAMECPCYRPVAQRLQDQIDSLCRKTNPAMVLDIPFLLPEASRRETKRAVNCLIRAVNDLRKKS